MRLTSSAAVVGIIATVICAIGNVSRGDDEESGDDKTPVVKEIRLTGYRSNLSQRGSVTKPKEITNVADLALAIKNMEVREKIKKQVDFEKQKLVFFRWAGSGMDKIEAKQDKDDEGEKLVVFQYTRGRTRDLRTHARLFAVQKGVKWKVGS